MADPMGVKVDTYRDPTKDIEGALLEDQVGTTDGEWVCVQGYDKVSIHVLIAATGTVKLCGSNEPAPANSDHGYQIFDDITNSKIVALKTPIKWIKARVTATTGLVSAYFNGV